MEQEDPKTLAYTVAGQQTPPAGTHVCPTCGLEIPMSIGNCPRDGTPITVHGQPGMQLVGNYDFLQFIGAGGMGVIYKAKHPVLNRLVAIKMLHGHLVSDAIIKRFQQEAEAVSTLDHRNIIHVHDYGVSEHNQPYMVMDFVEGKPLSDVLQTTPLSMEAVINIVIQLTEGLQHAHDRGVLHRDLKPSNIMVTDYDCAFPEVKIVDFGIAKVLESEKTRMTQTGELIGTPQYMSPEQCRGGTLDARSDIYALGCVLFEAITGKALFAGHSMVSVIVDQMNTAPRTLHEARPDMTFPGQLEDLVAKALAKDPADRYQSMTEFSQDLIEVQKIIARQSASAWSKIRVWRLNKEQRNLFLLMLGSFATLGTVAITSISFIKVVHDSQIRHIKKVVLSDPQAEKATISGAKSAERRRLLPYLNMEKADDELLRTFFDVETGVTRFDLQNHHITSSGIPYISSQSQVESLHLENNQIKDSDLTFIATMPKLERLYLDCSKVTDEGMKKLSGMSKLTGVSLSGTQISDRGVEHLAKLKLTSLALSNTKISGKALSIASRFENLERLELGTFCPKGEKNLAALAKAKALEVLELKDNQLSVEDLADVATIASLKSLDLANCSIEDGALQNLKSLPHLKVLDLSSTELSPSKVKEIAQLPALVTLELKSSDVNDETLAQVANLMPGLQNLDLKNTVVTEKGVLQLSNLSELKSVELRGCAVSKKSADMLKKALHGAAVKF
ncbi:MAG: protein kinase [Candidatus Melainabacteria bacterium]|nr:protein kinase [Candidatus Melainabacteria bacterium]